jgi:hypothetical protein
LVPIALFLLRPTMLAGERGGCLARMHVEFRRHCRDVVVNRSGSDRQTRRYLGIAQTIGHGVRDLNLAR